MELCVSFEELDEQLDAQMESSAEDFDPGMGQVMRGPPGRDGISPDVTVERIAGGHRVHIVDADSEERFDVLDGDARIEALTNMEIEEMLQ